jgi:DNA topoisomerase VI subunit A
MRLNLSTLLPLAATVFFERNTHPETHEAYVEELELMEEQGTKCELEALAAHSFTYLATEFLERAVTRHEFI